MRTIILSLIGSAAIFCSCDGFLDKSPYDSINTSNFYKTEADAIAAINAAYQPLQWPKLYNMRMWTTDIMAGNSIVGAGGGDDGQETQDEANFVTSTDNAGVLDLWRGPFPGILRANLVLENVPNMTINESIKNRIIGEAYFLRAHYYFILVQFFGDVPLFTHSLKPGDNLQMPRNPKEDVYKQIISDLENAMSLLPTRDKYSESDKGRASKGAAIGELAKVNLVRQNWTKVVELCDMLTQMDYALNANYADNFNPSKKNGIESLFEIQYASNGGYDFWSNENQASWLSTYTGPRGADMVALGWGWNQPTQEFVNSYENGDLRKDVTILYEGCPKFDGKSYSSSYSYTGYNLRKFLVTKSISSSYDNSPMNFPVLRYADVLLMKAEALNELGQTTAAAEPLNLVRHRAGLGDVVTGLSQVDFREVVLHERRIELAFEGQRWFDLIRVQNGQYGLNFLHKIGRLNATEKHLLFPIPQKERDANPNLTQNPGY